MHYGAMLARATPLFGLYYVVVNLQYIPCHSVVYVKRYGPWAYARILQNLGHLRKLEPLKNLEVEKKFQIWEVYCRYFF